jgi:hypothetical protein
MLVSGRSLARLGSALRAVHSSGRMVRGGAAAILAVLAAASTAQSPRPGFAWSTYLGGTVQDLMFAMRYAANGDLLIAGATGSANHPVTAGAHQPKHQGPATWMGEGIFLRIRDDAQQPSIVWSSFLGGSGDDIIFDIVDGPGGVVTVCGGTRSPVFEGQTSAGGVDAFVARFVWEDGSRMIRLWSTLISTPDDESASGLALHPDGSIVVVGLTNSPGLPRTAGRFQPNNAGAIDLFAAVLDDQGRLQYATYLGGSRDESYPGNVMSMRARVVLDAAGHPVVSGATSQSPDFPTTAAAVQPAFGGGGSDAVLARLDITLRRLTYGTYLGGSGDDELFGLSLGPDGLVTVAGYTKSTNYPVTNGTTFGGNSPSNFGGDIAVTTLDLRLPGALGLVWSTYLGRAGSDFATSLAVDRHGAVTVGGSTADWGFPTTAGAAQPRHGGATWDNFVCRFDPPRNGDAHLSESTFLGGRRDDANLFAIALDGRGEAVVLGSTTSDNYPTTPGCLQPGLSGGQDTVVTKLTMLPTWGAGVVRYGASTPACLHPIWQDVDRLPQAGQPLEVRAHGAPPRAPGVMLVGLEDRTGWPFLNLDVLVAAGSFVGVGVLADGYGSSSLSLVLPNPLSPAPIASQWVFLTDTICPGTGMLASSEGLRWW